MIKWFFKFFFVMLKIAAVIFLILVPYQTYSEYLDPWDEAASVREYYSDTHFIIVAGGSWNSDEGTTRQVLLLISKAWDGLKSIEIFAGSDQTEVRSGYYLLLVLIGLFILSVFTLTSVFRWLMRRIGGDESTQPSAS